MALCKDPALTYLNSLGYNVVRLPRSGILPLEVLGKGRDRQPEPLGTISTVWQSKEATPAAKEDETTEIRGASTSSLKLSVGIKLLENFLGALGASTPSVRASYRKASQVQFRFGKPKVLTIDPLVVGEYLREGDLATDNPVVRRFFFDEDHRAYIITEVLQSNAVSVSAQDESAGGVEVDVPAIQGALKGELKVEVTQGTKGDLTYEGPRFLTFGFKAYQIAFFEGRWDVDRVPATDENALLAGGEEAAKKSLVPPIVFRDDQLPLI